MLTTLTTETQNLRCHLSIGILSIQFFRCYPQRGERGERRRGPEGTESTEQSLKESEEIQTTFHTYTRPFGQN